MVGFRRQCLRTRPSLRAWFVKGCCTLIVVNQPSPSVLLRAWFVPFLGRSRTLPLRAVRLLLLINRNWRRSLAIQRRNFARNALCTIIISPNYSFLDPSLKSQNDLRILFVACEGFARL
jgi:hypothetical protein